MNLKKFIIGGIVGGIVDFILGGIFYGVLFTNIYPQNPNTNTTFIALGCMTFGFFMSYIFTKWAGITIIMKGITTGAIVGLLYGLSMNFFMYSNMAFNAQNFITDTVINTIMGAGVGAVIALVHGKIK